MMDLKKLKPLYTAFLHGIKLSEYGMGMKFDKGRLAVEQNSHTSKIVNVYIIHDLDAWPKILLTNFTTKSCCLVQLV